jgi:hypothetical protein
MIETGACSYGSCSPPAEHRTPGMGWSCCSGTLRGYETLPAWSMASGRSPEQRDKRLVPDVVSVLRTYHLRITTCRESGHHTTAPGKRPIWCPRTAMAARRRRSASRRTWAGRQNGDPTGWPGTPAANGSWSPRFGESSTTASPGMAARSVHGQLRRAHPYLVGRVHMRRSRSCPARRHCQGLLGALHRRHRPRCQTMTVRFPASFTLLVGRSARGRRVEADYFFFGAWACGGWGCLGLLLPLALFVFKSPQAMIVPAARPLVGAATCTLTE